VNFLYGDSIGAAATFANVGTLYTKFVYGGDGTGTPPPPRNWTQSSNRGIAGLRFDIGGTTHFGWADVQVNEDTTFTINSLAYEDQADTPILAGVPEPTATGALIAGAAGVAALLRRRRARV
jgi:hypothetical protein